MKQPEYIPEVKMAVSGISQSYQRFPKPDTRGQHLLYSLSLFGTDIGKEEVVKKTSSIYTKALPPLGYTREQSICPRVVLVFGFQLFGSFE